MNEKIIKRMEFLNSDDFKFTMADALRLDRDFNINVFDNSVFERTNEALDKLEKSRKEILKFQNDTKDKELTKGEINLSIKLLNKFNKDNLLFSNARLFDNYGLVMAYLGVYESEFEDIENHYSETDIFDNENIEKMGLKIWDGMKTRFTPTSKNKKNKEDNVVVGK